jgi:acetyl esterase/lipase
MKYPITRPVAQLYRPAASLRIRPRSAGNYVQHCNQVYAEAHGLGLLMDVFAPECAGNGLGIVDVVSGGWYADRIQLNQHIGLGVYDVFCARGYTVFAVSPGSITKFTGFDMVRHVHEAIRHIKAKSTEFGIDANRLGLTGASAGGHIAALVALDPKPGHPESRDAYRRPDSSVRAVGLFFPPTDLLDYGGKLFDFIEAEGAHRHRLIQDDGPTLLDEATIRERLIALSPARQVKHLPPPFLLMHGTDDAIVPLSQSQKLVAAIQSVGGSATLLVKEGGGHPWPDIRDDIARLADWFDATLRAS